MTDSLGWHRTFGVITPSVPAEFQAMRPARLATPPAGIGISAMPVVPEPDAGRPAAGPGSCLSSRPATAR
jgi:hypothetical protein